MVGSTSRALLDPPPPWTNQRLVLYHGTTEAEAAEVLQSGVRVARGLDDCDFGRGFYTTTVRQQANQWAWRLASRTLGAAPAVLEFEVDRNELSRLDTLSFVRGDDRATEFWSFVVHCRLRRTDHAREGSKKQYDVVVGPVAAFWDQYVTMQGSDQISFHTPEAERLLNSNSTTRRRVW